MRQVHGDVAPEPALALRTRAPWHEAAAPVFALATGNLLPVEAWSSTSDFL
jgi:hypothetical protein